MSSQGLDISTHTVYICLHLTAESPYYCHPPSRWFGRGRAHCLAHGWA